MSKSKDRALNPLFIPLKKKYFLSFKDGTKQTEYRLYGARWHEGNVIIGREVTLSLGYAGERINGTVINMRKIKNNKITNIYPQGVTLCAIDISVS